MFTGIIEELGEAESLDWHGDGGVLTIRGPLVAADARHGDSIAVNGVCLTVVSVQGGTFTVDVMKETFDRSALGGLAPGDPVNLERAATLATRLGGHLVQGHVDGVGAILSRTPGERWDAGSGSSAASAREPDFALVRIALPPSLSRYVVEKGSITVDGVSLTVVSVTDAPVDPDPAPAGPEHAFTVSLIPTTLELTTLGRKRVGALVNLEVDVVAKYVERLLAKPGGLPLTGEER